MRGILCVVGVVALLTTVCYSNASAQRGRSFLVDEDNHVLMKDGLPFQYISGSIHYHRIPVTYWKDRLIKMKAAGLDAIQIYVPWNFHEPEEGHYLFEDEHDIEKFIQLADEQHLLVIVRAGPYICGEWTFGGLPGWLLRKNPNMVLRSHDPAYFDAVRNWFKVLLPKLRKYLYSNGGPVIMLQLENEYGSYTTCDAVYMADLYELARQLLGPDIVLFTTDGGADYMLKCGSPDPRLLTTIDFGPTHATPNQSFAALAKYRPNLPWINSEFYTGWLDHWGDGHHYVSTDLIVDSLIRLITYSNRISVNLYMFHGGTNFGFWNGANTQPYSPQITSYDYDAPISEAGDITHKYWKIREAIYRWKKQEPPPLPQNTTKRAYGTIDVVPISHILDNLSHGVTSTRPLSMEQMRKYEGLMAYKTPFFKYANQPVRLSFKRFADVAHIYTTTSHPAQPAQSTYHGTISRNSRVKMLQFNTPRDTLSLIIVTENAGYINYGGEMFNDVKGLIDGVFVGAEEELLNWTMIPIHFDQLPAVAPSINNINPVNELNTLRSSPFHHSIQPIHQYPLQGSIFFGTLTIQQSSDLADTFISLDTFTRGLVFINRHLIGRYDQLSGPQLRLFVPRQFLRVGTNLVHIVELNTVWSFTRTRGVVTFSDQMLWTNKKAYKRFQ